MPNTLKETVETKNSNEHGWSRQRKLRFARTLAGVATVSAAIGIPVSANAIHNAEAQTAKDLKPSGSVMFVEKGDGAYSLVDRILPGQQEDRAEAVDFLEKANKDVNWTDLQIGTSINIPTVIEKMVEEYPSPEK